MHEHANISKATKVILEMLCLQNSGNKSHICIKYHQEAFGHEASNFEERSSFPQSQN
jgi:hypothetical protein